MSQTEPQSARAVASRTIFCEHCIAETSDETPGNIKMGNFFGKKFYGSDKPCPQCTSVVSTLWWTIAHLPIVPLGSYRYLKAEQQVRKELFWSRKLPALHWKQVWQTWALGLVAAVAIGIALYYYETRKHG